MTEQVPASLFSLNALSYPSAFPLFSLKGQHGEEVLILLLANSAEEGIG